MKSFNLIILILFAYQLDAQQLLNPNDYILVYFMKGVEREKTITENVAKISTRFKAHELKNRLATMGLSEEYITPSSPDFNEADTIKILSDGSKIAKLNLAKLFKVKVPKGKDKSEILSDLNKMEEVLYAEPFVLDAPNVSPDDTDYNLQWGLKNNTNIGADINAEAAWDIYTGNPNNIIAIIDYGINPHPDFASKIIFSDQGYSKAGHGIKVAGVAAAIGGNGQGIAGVDWNAKIYARRMDLTGGDPSVMYQIITGTVDYSPNVYVLNNSWSSISGYDNLGNGIEGLYNLTHRQAFAYVYKQNRVAIAASGNHQLLQPGVVSYPGGYDNVMAVGELVLMML